MPLLVWERDTTITLDCHINTASRSITVNRVNIRLSKSQFKVFLCIWSHSPYVVTRQMIYEHLEKTALDGSKLIDVYLTQIKRLLRERCPEAEQFLQNVHGRGFKLSGAAPAKGRMWSPRYKVKLVRSINNGSLSREKVLAMYPDMLLQELEYYVSQYQQSGIAGLRTNGIRTDSDAPRGLRRRRHFT